MPVSQYAMTMWGRRFERPYLLSRTAIDGAARRFLQWDTRTAARRARARRPGEPRRDHAQANAHPTRGHPGPRSGEVPVLLRAGHRAPAPAAAAAWARRLARRRQRRAA